MDEYLTEKTPQKFFVESGFNEEVIGIKQLEQQSACSWKKAYEKNGLFGLTDIRKTEPGRTLKRELTPSEVIERQNARIKHLDGKVELLKKLESKKRRLLNTRENLCPSMAYQLIQETIE
ncbi:hypothetical protein [Peribacillus muralis]|uniref:hypothetical protein n=1 Tax=Peribacillus muralis TaxID=264697 RepID=UPI0036715DDC